MKRFWTPQNAQNLSLTTVGGLPQYVDTDGSDVWTSNTAGGSVSRVRASDGKLLETWTGATSPEGLLAVTGRVFVAGNASPGKLYRIDPTQPAGLVTTVATNLGNNPIGIAYDGALIWTANDSGSVSIVTPGPTVPWSAATVSVGFSSLHGVLYDGANIWVTDLAGTLLKLDSGGAVLQTVTVGMGPFHPLFDGTNIWVPNSGSNSVSVVRASNGAVLATLTANGLDHPLAAGFDGQRILVASADTNVVSLWKAADLTPLGNVGIGGVGSGVCSDGLNFWITLPATNQLARF
jgi:YVTN family beta-propeller protein